MNTRVVGRYGESIAEQYLKKQKYKIVDRNFFCHFGEIDLIAWDGESVIFVEVKSRKDDQFGLPREAVTWRKQQTIVKCATYWLYKNKQTGVPVRFDVIEILGDKINHIKDAFRP